VAPSGESVVTVVFRYSTMQSCDGQTDRNTVLWNHQLGYATACRLCIQSDLKIIRGGPVF